METWLQPNRRALACAAVLAAIVGVGGALAWGGARHAASRGAGAACVAIALGLGIGLWRHGRRPRIAWDGQHVLFFVRGARPVAVPLRAVEAFFLGQGPAHVPLAGSRTETVNLVTRLSHKFPDLARGAVKPALAQWCDHYLTLRGAWCEPLTGEVVRRLNRRLREVQQTAPTVAPPGEGAA